MLDNRYAIIDIGTNTFHLIIVDIQDGDFSIVRKERELVRLGLGGIDKKVIVPDAELRALRALNSFHTLGKEHQVSAFFVYATSAVRNASNKETFIKKVFDETGLVIQVIDGDREAELIYKGVKLGDGVLHPEPSLIIDIGGGSVEFIIANEKERLWMQSFEIGGQRLKNMFHTVDPISKEELDKLYQYLKDQLKPVLEACLLYTSDAADD